MTNLSWMHTATLGEGIARPRHWISSFADLMGWNHNFLTVLVFSMSGLQVSVWLLTQTWLMTPDAFASVMLP